MRTNLGVEDLDGFLEEPLVAVLATLRQDGSVLLSPVYHEWDAGGFNLWIPVDSAHGRNLQRDPRATIVVAESGRPLRGVELRGTVRFADEDVMGTARRLVVRYEGEAAGARITEHSVAEETIVRLEPGEVRMWDFADEFDS